jgi:hypothetical protein
MVPRNSVINRYISYICVSTLLLLGEERKSANIHSWTPCGSSDGFTFHNLSLPHGTHVYATVRCTNHVQLTSEVSSRDPLVVYQTRPDVTNAVVHFVQQGNEAHGAVDHVIQTDKTSLVLTWNGFDDVTGLDHYRYRLTQDGAIFVDWTDIGKRTYAVLTGLTLVDGAVYRAEVKAYNLANLESSMVNTSVVVDGRAPRLTGALYLGLMNSVVGVCCCFCTCVRVHV